MRKIVDVVDPTYICPDEWPQMVEKFGQPTAEKLFCVRRRKPIPPDEDLALVATMKGAVGFLQGFEALVLKVGGATAAKEIDTALRAQAAEIARRRKQGEDITIPALNPAHAVICNEASVAVLVVLGVFAAGVAELRKPRARGEKIDRTPFGIDSEDFVARVFNIAYQMGLDYKRPPNRPTDSMAEVAVKVARRGQEGAAGVRHHHRKRLE